MSGTKFSNTTPPAPVGRQLIQFQADGQGNISASIPTGGGGGGVSSVAMTGDGVIFNATVPGSPITATGTLAPSLLTQAANKVLVGPTSGGAVAPTFRLLVAGDIPNLPASIITTGQLALARGGTNADLSATGGASKVLKQVSVGAAITVDQLAASDLSNGVTGSGALVLATSPTLVTPVLGVASATSLTTPLISTATAQLQLQETGDTLGQINIYLRNRSGSNGAIFENPSVCLTDFGMQTSAIITNIAINGSNVLTVTAAFAPVASSLPSVGQKLTLSGLTTATFLNGQVVTIATISATQFTATFTHALYASAPDTGIAVAQNNVRAEFRNDKVSSLNPNGEIQFLDPITGTPWFASGIAQTLITGQLGIGTSPPLVTLGIGGDGFVKSQGTSSQFESNDGTVRGITGVQAFTTGGYQIGTTTSHPVRFYVGGTQIAQYNIAATLPTQTNQPLHIAGGFSSPVAAKIYVGDGTGWELDFAKRIASTDTTLFKMKDSGVLDIATGITIAGAATTGNVLRGNGTNFVSAALIAADIPSLDASKITTGLLALARGGTNADLSATGGASQVLKQVSAGAAITVGQLAASDLSNGVTGSGAVVLATAPTITSLAMSGKITTYNNITTVGNGVPSEVASVALTLQSAAKVTTTLYAVPASGAGQYRVSWNAKVTRAATTSSTLGALTITYTDPDGVVITTTMPGTGVNPTTGIGESVSTNTTGSVLFGFPLTLNCKASTNITYAFAYVSSGATTMQYNLNILLEAH
jgi:hypothetical protein